MARAFLIAVLLLAALGLPLAAQIAFKSGDSGLDATLNSLNL